MAGIAVFIGGVPGVGKTLLLDRHVALNRTGDVHVTGSSVLRSVIAPATIGEFDTWSSERKAASRSAAIERLRELRATATAHLLVTGHLTLRNHETGLIEPSFTGADADFYAALVLVEAPADQVARWRAGDPRQRAPELPGWIIDHLSAERDAARCQVERTGVPYLELSSPELDVRLESLAAFLDARRGDGAGR